MLGSSNAKVRQSLSIASLSAIFLLSLIIMGIIGVNGKITFRSVNNACLLFMTDEFSPRPVSISFLAMSMVLSLFSFAICAEIGIGLNKGCNILGDQRHHCHSGKNFAALYGAEICAGLMGGFWLMNTLLEFFQFKSMPRHTSAATSDGFGQTRVTPHPAGKAELSEHPEMVSTPQSQYQHPQKQELHSTEVYYPNAQAYAAPSYPPGTPARQTTTTT
ncbi:hypothetical protein CPB97_008578 [Podila verticillata]|nr:hypothetical protein CPB97_008578 [Podila verticillata]